MGMFGGGVSNGGGGSGTPGAAKFEDTFGDGVATSFDIAHGLASTAVIVQVRDTVGGHVVFPDIYILDADTVRITILSGAPAADALTIVVIG